MLLVSRDVQTGDKQSYTVSQQQSSHYTLERMAIRSPLVMAVMLPIVAVMGFGGLSAAETCGDHWKWTDTVLLSQEIDFHLDYRLDETSQNIFLRLRSKSTGFLSVGLSEAGQMMGSDIVVVSIEQDGTKNVRVRDMFVDWDSYPASPYPIDDKCNDWVLECSSLKQNTQSIVISRAVNTGDPQDREVNVDGHNSVIFAWGKGKELSYHGPNRGTTLISFGKPIDLRPNVADDVDGSLTLRLNGFVLKNKRTTYALQKYDLGESIRHVVGYELEIEEADQSLVHHIIVHECGHIPNAIPLNFVSDKNATASISPARLGACQSVLVAWARGSPVLYTPRNVGFRIGHRFTRFVIMEVHLDNPGLLQGNIVTSGVRLITTSRVRTYDASSLTLGDASLKFKAVPPGLSHVHYESTCPSACTSTFDGEIHLFGSGLHLHNHGREAWTTMYRQGSGPGMVIDSRQFWSAGVQFSRQINVTVRPGDQLSTHCVYDTTKTRDTSLKFGLATYDEMCMDFIFYYPKEHAGVGCGYSQPNSSVCRNGHLFNTPNPIPDGDLQVPQPLRKGEPPLQCAAKRTPQSSLSTSSVLIETPIMMIGPIILLLMLATVFLWARKRMDHKPHYEAVETSIDAF